MRKLILKELREHFAGVVMGVLIYGFLIAAFYPTFQEWSGRQVSLYLENLKPFIVIICILLGLAIGGKQMHTDSQRDLRAFLIHRPMTGSQIFMSKALAGGCIYTVISLMPLIGLRFYENMKYQVPLPWTILPWELFLPVFAPWLAGLVCYFAAMLTNSRRARWLASKSVGVLFGGFMIVVSFNESLLVDGPWSANLVLILTALILAVAAWGSFVSDGEQKGLPLLSRLCLTMMLAVGSALFFYIFVNGSEAGLSILTGKGISHPVYKKFEPLLSPIISCLIEKREELGTMVILKVGVSLFLIIPVGWVLGQRYQFLVARQLGWAIFYLFFGLCGLLACLAVHDWPLLIACPKCKRGRVVDREQCANCGAGFEPVAETGIEIFERGTVKA